jgi:Na+/proline symporter
MEPQASLLWVWILLGLYIVYCFYWGLRGYFTERTSSGYTIGGRSIPMIAFLMAATAASFSGWTTIGHPGLIWRDGLAYAFASFYCLTIPLTGTFFAKRNWMLGKRYGFVTPGDMYAYYYNNEGVRWLVVITAFLYGVFYSAVQLMAAGALFHWVTGFPTAWGAIFLAAIVWFYVVTGGLRASTWVGVLQFVLLVLTIVIIGSYTLHSFGGWTELSTQIKGLGPEFTKVPGVVKFTVGETHWTGIMILTYMFALMGIQSSPAFTMWNFANKNPKPFPWQQTFMSTFIVGFAMFYFLTFQGLGGQILGQQGVLPIQQDSDLVPMLMSQYLPSFALGICFIGLIAAMHSTAAPYIGTCGSIILRDVWWLKVRKKKGGHGEQIWVNRVFVTIVTIIALIVGLTSKAALVMLGGLATAFGFVMWIPQIGVLWGYRWPGIAAFFGILFAMLAVFFTYQVWKYPVTIHCAAWGVGIGLLVAYLIRLMGAKDKQETIERQRELRNWIDNAEAPNPRAKSWRKSMAFIVPIWMLFAIGPACVLSNNAFSFAGMPAVWSWQIVWWTLGIVMMWALCFKCELSKVTDDQIQRAENEPNIVVEETT